MLTVIQSQSNPKFPILAMFRIVSLLVFCCYGVWVQAHDLSSAMVSVAQPSNGYWWAMPVFVCLAAGLGAGSVAYYYQKKQRAKDALQTQQLQQLRTKVSDFQDQTIRAYQILAEDSSRHLQELRKGVQRFFYAGLYEETRELANQISERLQIMERVNALFGNMKNAEQDMVLVPMLQAVLKIIADAMAPQQPPRNEFATNISVWQTLHTRSAYNLAIALAELLHGHFKHCFLGGSFLIIKLFAPCHSRYYTLQILDKSGKTLTENDLQTSAMATVRAALNNVSAKITVNTQHGAIEILFV